MDTAAVDSDTAVEELSSPPVESAVETAPAPLPETEVDASAPETEDSDAPETEELTLDDPRVQELLKGERASLEESYRRRAEDAERKAQAQEYERQRQQAYNYRVENVAGQISKMIEAAQETGSDADPKALQDLLTEVSATGLIETVEGMQGWVNEFLAEDNEDFFKSIPPEYERAWTDAVHSRRPDVAFTTALRIAAASGEARGYKAGESAALKALRKRETEKEKTQRIRQASEAQANEGTPAMGLSGTPKTTYTLEEIDKMPTNEWMALGTKEERDKILKEAHSNANAMAQRG